jgi:hypothetical protein
VTGPSGGGVDGLLSANCGLVQCSKGCYSITSSARTEQTGHFAAEFVRTIEAGNEACFALWEVPWIALFFSND